MANEAKRFYKGSGIAKHREWRGLKDTFYDYTQWVVNLGILVKFITKSPVRIVRGLFEYRWFGAYMGTLHMIDRSLAGMRGPALRVSHTQMHAIMKGATGRRQHDRRSPLRRHEKCREVCHARANHVSRDSRRLPHP